MKKTVKSVLIAVLAIVVIVSSLIVVAAEEVKTSEDETEIVTIEDGDGTRAYELIWKYKEQDGHLWRRRWNMTLGDWYDPDWILVY